MENSKIKRIIIFATSIILIFSILIISVFAVPTSDYNLSRNDNTYYLFRYYNTSSNNFRIYVQNYMNQVGLYIDSLGWQVDITNLDFTELNNNVNTYSYVNKKNDYMFLNTVLASFSPDAYFDYSTFYYSNVFENNVQIKDAFFNGYYTLNSKAMNSSYSDFNDYVTNFNNGTEKYFDWGAFKYFTSLEQAIYYNAYLVDPYYQNGLEINNQIWIAQTEYFRNLLCKSIFNILYYEFNISS